jgi:simple sugar transport system substrate-binding protein
MVLGVDVATAALDAKANANEPQIKVATFDLSTAVLNGIKSGTILFAVNSQPYLQGYYSILALYNDVQFNLAPIGEINTGPILVTPANVQKDITLNQEHPGVLGSE